MKKITTTLLLLVLLSCHKTRIHSEIDPGNCFPEPIYVGKWEMRIKFCGWGGQTTLNPGNGNTLTLYENGQFSSTGIITDTGKYRITPWVNNQGQTRPLLHLTGSEDQQYEMNLTRDTLSLDNNSTIADGCSYTYKKL